MVVEDRLENLVDRGFGILSAWLERLGHLVKQQTAAVPLGRHRGDPAVADERPQLLRRVGEQTFSVMTHRKQFDILPLLKEGDSSYYADWSSR